MNIKFNTKLAEKYHSPSQIARVLTEDWAKREAYCPQCGEKIWEYENNRPVADFYCAKCKEDYELKSKNGNSGKKINDGTYSTMIERLNAKNNPNFFFLNYSSSDWEVKNLIVIPKHFFVPSIIEKRKPLLPPARRSGWIGCNILMGGIPERGKIFYIKDGKAVSQNKVLDQWQKTLFLREIGENDSKGWILDIMQCIDKLGAQEFTLSEIYAFEDTLARKYPRNNFIKDKIRQQLQILRDRGYLEFSGRGKYKLVT
ncbi:MAG: DpnI domain-containing protein [Candidatus Pacebacteria bacterium]|nr:DpnI domain-containing protein [Candidatus Paceibacterota bacterium]